MSWTRYGVIFFLALLGEAQAAPADLSSPAGASGQGTTRDGGWCRFDDPGTTEAVRRERKVGNDKIAEIPCPARADAGTLPEELWLPLPCRHYLGLRKVEIGIQNVLDQQEVFLGDENLAGPVEDASQAREKVQSGPWNAAISAPLVVPKAGSVRAYYIGKYEISEIQYQIFRKGLFEPEAERRPGACADIEAMDAAVVGTRVFPATQVTWAEARAFADALTRFLIRKDQARLEARQPPIALPWIESTPSYLRLPTEVEWEFAARGGESSQATRRQKLHSVFDENGVKGPATIDDIASLISPQSPAPDGHNVLYMGRKKPNTLGLYDMLGNADEMTQDLFRLVNPDLKRLGAVEGGVVLRGGNATDTPDAIAVGMRREMLPYRRDGAAKSSVTGFRLVLSGPILINKANEKYEDLIGNPDLDATFLSALKGQRRPVGETEVERTRVLEEVERLKQDVAARHVTAEGLTQRLQELRVQLDQANAAINERDRRNLQQQLINQAGLAVGYNNLYRRVKLAPVVMEKIVAIAHDPSAPQTHRDVARKQIEDSKKEEARLTQTKKESFDLYVNSLAQSAREGAKAVEDAIAIVQQQEKNRSDLDFRRGLKFSVAHLREFIKSNGAMSDETLTRWREDLEQRFIESK